MLSSENPVIGKNEWIGIHQLINVINDILTYALYNYITI